MEITEVPAAGLFSSEQLQSWKNYNLTEIRLFTELITPWYNRFRERRWHDHDEFKQQLLEFFQDLSGSSWSGKLVLELQSWIEASRVESPGAEPVYRSLEQIIQESLASPIESAAVDEFALAHTFPSTSPAAEPSTDQ